MKLSNVVLSAATAISMASAIGYAVAQSSPDMTRGSQNGRVGQEATSAQSSGTTVTDTGSATRGSQNGNVGMQQENSSSTISSSTSTSSTSSVSDSTQPERLARADRG